MRLIAYIRVSTDDQAANGHSLGQQIERITAWAAALGHTLVATVTDDGVSASIPLAKRPGGARVLETLRAGQADGVAVIRLDRLFRNALDGLTFFEVELAGLNASVVSLTESIDTSTPSGWLSLIMQLAVADYARRLDVQRGLETNRALRASGKVYGAVPFGCVAAGGEPYDDDGRARTRGANLLRDPVLWAVRQDIVNMRTAGMAYSKIADTLRRAAVKNPSGGRAWAKSTIKGIVESHLSLAHLPFSHSATATPHAQETEVSHATRH